MIPLFISVALFSLEMLSIPMTVPLVIEIKAPLLEIYCARVSCIWIEKNTTRSITNPLLAKTLCGVKFFILNFLLHY